MSDRTADRKDPQQDVFVREVDDALRQDEMASFLSRFGIPLAVLVVVGLLAFAGYLWWQHNERQEAGARSEQFIQAIDDLDAGNNDAADKKLAPLALASGGDATAAKLLRAGIALQQNRSAEAIRIYAEVAADDDAPKPYRDLAAVREVGANFDAMKPQAVVDRLKPLAVPGSPWFGVAGELVGMAYLKQGKEELAGPLFAKIARDEELPESLRARARQLSGLLGVDAIDDVIEDDATRKARAALVDAQDASDE